MRPADLVAALAIKWTTAYRTLAYLRDQGYVVRDDQTGVYRVGPRLYFIGSSYVAHHQLLQIARPYLKDAVNESGVTGQLVERYGNYSVVLMAFEPQSMYLPKTTVGFHFPLHCGSKGHVLLAHSAPEFIDEYLSRPLEALTEYTVTDPEQLRRVLESVRAKGYAVTQRDVRVPVASAAAPIFDAGKNAIAAFTLMSDVRDFLKKKDILLDIVLHSTSVISAAMGSEPVWRRGVHAESGSPVVSS